MVKKRGGWSSCQTEIGFEKCGETERGRRGEGGGKREREGGGGMKRHESTLRRAAGIARNSFSGISIPVDLLSGSLLHIRIFPSSSLFFFFFDQLPLPRKMLHRYLELFSSIREKKRKKLVRGKTNKINMYTSIFFCLDKSTSLPSPPNRNRFPRKCYNRGRENFVSFRYPIHDPDR